MSEFSFKKINLYLIDNQYRGKKIKMRMVVMEVIQKKVINLIKKKKILFHMKMKKKKQKKKKKYRKLITQIKMLK